MQVLVNEAYIEQKKKLGRYGTIAGLTLLGVGFAISLLEQTQAVDVPGLGPVPVILISYILLFPGLVLFNIGRVNAIRWGIRPREDEILTASLKGLDGRFHLYHFMPQVPRVEHFMIGPGGIVIFQVRHHMGEIHVAGDRWWRKPSFGAFIRGMAEGALGNPARDAERDEEDLRAYLAQQAGAELAEKVPVEAIAVFVNPRVQLVIESEPTIPVRLPRDVKTFVRQNIGPRTADRLTQDELNQLWAAFEA